MFGHALPDYDDARWREFAALTFVEDESGVPRAASDPRIGDAVRTIPAPPGATQAMWLAFAALALDSDARAARRALRSAVARRRSIACSASCRSSSASTIPNRGHPPQLDEPRVAAAIDRFLARVQ